MARHGTTKTQNRASRSTTARRRRLVGLGSGAGAVLAFGMGPWGFAPPARADIFDVVIDPIIQPLQQALTGVSDALAGIDPSVVLDSLAAVDPTAGLAALDLGTLVDPGSVGAGAADLVGSGAGVVAASATDPVAAIAASAADPSVDPLAAATSAATGSTDATGATAFDQWFNQDVYLPLHTDMENWINSQFGTRVDDFINNVSGHDLIGNGANGTAADPDGGNAGSWFGDGGAGDGPTGDGGNAGWIMGNGGNAGERHRRRGRRRSPPTPAPRRPRQTPPRRPQVTPPARGGG